MPLPMTSTISQQQLDTSSSAMPPKPKPWQSAGGSTTKRQNLPQWNVNQMDALEKRIRDRPEVLPPWIAPPPSTPQSNARLDAVEAGRSSFRSSQHNKVFVPLMTQGGTAQGMESLQQQSQQQQQWQSQQSPQPFQQQPFQQQQFQQRPAANLGPIGGRNRGTRLNKPMLLPLRVPMHIEQPNSKERVISIGDRRVVDYGRSQIGNIGLSGQAADQIAIGTMDNGPTRPEVLSSHRRYYPNTHRAAIA